ncbi:mechanosensitive ion channel family protein [Flavobacterium macacae]|uniref:Mechanosensitive ion channel family protein n=1 Tax=Flavobacterium macacae TaxID=2488993 RepID=A0A3P3W9Z3_9FLAO|nr:mechanosensitive ion channel family protein [Flavobacterium macacae]RRJ89463.1 mechanosensitive ion channel family protein [Flavobacterium macacae]
MSISIRNFFILTFIFLLNPVEIKAQLLPSSSEVKEEVKIPDDSLGRRNPRGTVNGFLKAVSEQNYIRASNYLYLKRSFRKNKERERIVKTMQNLLDQSGSIVPTSLISDKNTGNSDDELDAELDLVGTISINGKNVKLYVENNEREGSPPIWLFSAETVDAIAAVKVDENLLVNKILPESLKERLLAGVPIGQWFIIIVLVAGAYFLSWGIIALLTFIISKLWKKARTEPTEGFLVALSLPIQLYIALWFFIDFSQRVGISIIIRQRFSYLTVTVGIVAFLMLLWRITDFIGEFSKNRMTVKGRVSTISAILFLRRTFKVAIFIFGGIAILGAIGIDVTAGLAALGIGGIALALGAQKTVENFVGSVTLIIDQPIRVGDYCRINDIKGNVEQIGMRSTKVRTGERTVVTIPNGLLSATNIENYAFRDRFFFNPVLDLRCETTPDQIRFLLVEIRSILYSHPMVGNDDARVRFIGFGASSLRLEINAYILVSTLDTALEIKEDLYLRIMDLVSESGTGFAFPSQTLYFAKDDGISEEKSKDVSDKVKEWNERGEMQLPKFHPDKIKELNDSIVYPPKGSAVNKEKP